MNPMRILMIIEMYPPEFTGAGEQLARLAPRLAAQGVDIEILTSQTGQRDRTDRENGAVVHRLASGHWRRFTRFALRSAAWIIPRRSYFDIIHLHGLSSAGLFAALATRHAGAKTLMKFTMAGQESAARIQRLRGGWAKLRVIRRIDRYVCTSSALVGELLSAGFDEKRILRIPNGVDVDRFRPLADAQRLIERRALRDMAGWDEKTLVTAFMGGIEHRKGVDILIEAWPAIVRDVPGARLLLLGPTDHITADPAFIREMESRLDALGLRKTAWLAGRQSNPEWFLARSDLFVLPSRREGLPNALIEAQASGLPCVAADLPGITDDIVAERETGHIVPQEAPDLLASRIVSLLRNPDLRADMGRKARLRAVDCFNLDAVSARYVMLYRELARGKNCYSR